MTVNKKKIWKITFYLSVAIYVANVIYIIASGRCILFASCNAYNYISTVLSAVFLIIFYNFLRKGSLTFRYLLIMFGALVAFPFLVTLIFGGISFS